MRMQRFTILLHGKIDLDAYGSPPMEEPEFRELLAKAAEDMRSPKWQEISDAIGDVQIHTPGFSYAVQ